MPLSCHFFFSSTPKHADCITPFNSILSSSSSSLITWLVYTERFSSSSSLYPLGPYLFTLKDDEVVEDAPAICAPVISSIIHLSDGGKKSIQPTTLTCNHDNSFLFETAIHYASWSKKKRKEKDLKKATECSERTRTFPIIIEKARRVLLLPETGGWRGNAVRAGVWFTANTRTLQRVKKKKKAREREGEMWFTARVPFRLSPLLAPTTTTELYSAR